MAPSFPTIGPRFSSIRWSGRDLLAAYLTGAFCVAATGAWYVLRKVYHAEARIMLRMGLGLAAVLMPIQLLFVHLNGEYVNPSHPSPMAPSAARRTATNPCPSTLHPCTP